MRYFSARLLTLSLICILPMSALSFEDVDSDGRYTDADRPANTNDAGKYTGGYPGEDGSSGWARSTNPDLIKEKTVFVRLSPGEPLVEMSVARMVAEALAAAKKELTDLARALLSPEQKSNEGLLTHDRKVYRLDKAREWSKNPRVSPWDDQKTPFLRMTAAARILASGKYPVGEVVLIDSEYPPATLAVLNSSLIFNADWYRSKYPDLRSMTSQRARTHWLEHGAKERRSSAPGFDIGFYLSTYADIRNAVKNDPIKGIMHFASLGAGAGRQGSADFSARAYLSKYLDLRNAFGASGPAALLKATVHYNTTGYKEGRSGRP